MWSKKMTSQTTFTFFFEGGKKPRIDLKKKHQSIQTCDAKHVQTSNPTNFTDLIHLQICLCEKNYSSKAETAELGWFGGWRRRVRSLGLFGYVRCPGTRIGWLNIACSKVRIKGFLLDFVLEESQLRTNL